MKKLLFLFAASLLVFTSCSKDDKDSPDPVSPDPVLSVLLKKRIDIGDDGLSYASDYLYDGNKITSITDTDGSVMKYTYDGDLIVKIESIDKKGILDNVTEYNYINDKLSSSSRKVIGEDTYHKTKFVNNSDGTISYEKFIVDSKTEIESIEGTVGKLTFKDGNLIKDESSRNSGSQTVNTYEYDTKNNPFKNVLGFNLLDDESSVNNMIKQTQTNTTGDNVYIYITTYDYKYDSKDHPVEKVANFPNGDSIVKEISQFVY
jgi:hypothetical protein